MNTTLDAPPPPAGSAASATAPELGLPVQLTSFVGREREITQASMLLERTRLLTLTGAGGSGKTRLALELAARVAAEYEHGVRWIELAPLSDPTLLASAVSNQLGIREEPGRTPAQALIEFLESRSLLLVLDNCEHLIEACATLADTLLRSCPRLTLLATSREALGVAGETAWLVPPLSLPRRAEALPPEQLAEYEAVQLFVERAQFVLSAFALTEANAAAVAQICRRLDGIPLAIELAAARVKVLAPEQIAARLTDAFRLLASGSRTALPRHRTLRAAIDWSYQLLSEPERRLLERLSIFAGGCTIEAAESVCAGEGIEPWEVLDLLTGLVDKSLVVMEEHEASARYHLLETVRLYAFSRLEEAGEATALQRRHAEFFLALVEQAEPHLASPRRHPWLERLRPEHDNLRAALAWSAQAAEEINLRMVGALYWFWFLLGFWSEGRRWLAEALALPAANERGAVRANALLAAGTLAFWGGEPAAGRVWVEESRDLWGELGDIRRQAHASLYVGMCTLAMKQNPALARPAVEAAVAGFETVGDRWGLTHAYNAVGALLLLQQEFADASEIYQKSASIARELGDNLGLAIALQGVGDTARRQGDFDRAAAAFREAIAALRHEHDEMFIARILEALAFLVLEQGSAQEAARLVGAARSLRESVGAPVIELDRALHSESVAAIRARLGEEAFAAALTEGRTLTREQAIELALRAPGSVAPPTAPGPSASVTSPPSAELPATPQTVSTARAAATDETRTAAALRVLALGPLQIYREGEPLPVEAWPSAKPRELFFYLLAHPRGRTKEQIARDLWPDASPAQIRNSFHVTLHHLRKAFGRPEWVVFGDEQYRINPEIGYEFDATLFEQQISAALRDVRAGTAPVEALRAALDLYRGDFLQDEVVGDWHLEARDELRRLYVEGMFALGDLLMQREEYVEAAEIYQRIVRKEDLHEEAHRRLILCLARSGERARALRHYERLVVLLRAELDAEPEEETTEIYERLKQAELV